MGISLHSEPTGEPGGGGHLLGTLRDRWRRALETGHLSMGALLGEHGGGAALFGTLKDL